MQSRWKFFSVSCTIESKFQPRRAGQGCGVYAGRPCVVGDKKAKRLRFVNFIILPLQGCDPTDLHRGISMQLKSRLENYFLAYRVGLAMLLSVLYCDLYFECHECIMRCANKPMRSSQERDNYYALQLDLCLAARARAPCRNTFAFADLIFRSCRFHANR